MDLGYNYCHITHPNHVLYATKWLLEPIPYDDIDVDQLYEATAALLPEEEDEMSFALIKGSGRRKGKQTKPVWEDLSLEKFLSETPLEGYRDHTMVRAMFTADDESEGINEVLSNGYNVSHMAFNPAAGYSAMQLPPPLGYEPPSFATPATPRIRAPLATLLETPRVRLALTQTPRVPSGTPRNQTPFQTPITRIMR